jgi:predicted Rossmann fold flavoprotein
VIGGGAAGFFAAIQVAERNPSLKIFILEKGKRYLDKVRISGGGRCNVTHACFDPAELTTYYPRGHQALLGPFHQFMTGDMIAWLEEHGVKTKIESDGRIFPVSNKSETIINCFLKICAQFGIQMITQSGVRDFTFANKKWTVHTESQNYFSKTLFVATGSNTPIWNLLQKKGHQIVPPVPSLFTFRIKHPVINGLPGIAVQNGSVQIMDSKYQSTGPVLITHWGLSGPAILKLSAWGARHLADLNYNFKIEINWTDQSIAQVEKSFKTSRDTMGSKLVGRTPLFNIPKRLWANITVMAQIEQKKWASISNKEIDVLANLATCLELSVNGKSTFKDEFVTAGGIDLDEVDFKTMESKLLLNVFFGGEILDVDAVTGGFNFQAAWTTAWIAAKSIVAKC